MGPPREPLIVRPPTLLSKMVCACGHMASHHFGRGRNRQCSGAGNPPELPWRQVCRCHSYRPGGGVESKER